MATLEPTLHAELGELRAEYRRKTGRNVTLIALTLIAGIVGLVAGFLMPLMDIGGGACVSSSGLLLLVLGVVMVINARRDRDLAVRVHEAGLVYTRGGKEQIISWEEIRAVNHVVMRSRWHATHLCTLDLASNNRIQFSDATLENVAALCSAIESMTLIPLLRDVARRLEAGETVTFGKITASRDGLSNGQDLLPWSEVEAVRLNDHQVQVLSDGKWRYFALAGRVNNAHVLINLIARANAA